MTDLIGKEELSFYAEKLPALRAVISEITDEAEKSGYAEHIKTRIKSVESVKKKLEKKGLSFSRENAFDNLYDLAGVRLICKYADEIDKIFSVYENSDRFEIVRTKDY